MITCPHCGSTKVEKNGNCATFNRQQRKPELELKRKKAISRDPKNWNNTFLCSDGTRVTQEQIIETRNTEYTAYVFISKCEGCGNKATCHAHIIPQARCKVLGKTELIWNRKNWFYSCTACNLAIENPKGQAWKHLKNIEKCLCFIKRHDPELYAKFELSAVNQERETI